MLSGGGSGLGDEISAVNPFFTSHINDLFEGEHPWNVSCVQWQSSCVPLYFETNRAGKAEQVFSLSSSSGEGDFFFLQRYRAENRWEMILLTDLSSCNWSLFYSKEGLALFFFCFTEAWPDAPTPRLAPRTRGNFILGSKIVKEGFISDTWFHFRDLCISEKVGGTKWNSVNNKCRRRGYWCGGYPPNKTYLLCIRRNG